MFRSAFLVVAFSLTASVGCNRTESNASANPAVATRQQADELTWAKEVCDTFLEAAKSLDTREASLLFSSEMTESLRKTPDGDGTTYLSNRFRNWVVTSWKYKAERLSPDKNEASFHGVLRNATPGEAEFVLRVAKAKESGVWRVSFFSVGDWKAAAAEKATK